MDSHPRKHPASDRRSRLAGALALTMFGLLTLATGCPFSAEEFHRHCTVASDCSDGNPCTEDKCSAGLCENPFKPKESACGSAGDSVCDGAGKCVECVSSTDCVANHPMTPICDVGEHKCVSCDDGVKNGKETDVDCGGPDCGACLGQPCDPNNGCGNHTLCAKPENICCSTGCTDKCEACSKAKTGQPDGTCAPIPYGMDPDAECSTLGACGAAPGKCSCEDGVKNGDETDVDCGGATCSQCGGGKMCKAQTDCAVEVPGEIPICTTSGTCCESLCQQQCHACDTSGKCVAVPPGYPDMTCPANSACGPGTTGCIGKAGTSCSIAAQCLSGSCVSTKCAKSGISGACSTDSDCATGTCQNYICSL